LSLLQSTEHFERALQLRSEIRREWCEQIAADPIFKDTAANGRIRCWGWVEELNQCVRVVLLADGKTLHTAMIDSKFRRRPR
jgi:hypothetical protein